MGPSVFLPRPHPILILFLPSPLVHFLLSCELHPRCFLEGPTLDSVSPLSRVPGAPTAHAAAANYIREINPGRAPSFSDSPVLRPMLRPSPPQRLVLARTPLQDPPSLPPPHSPPLILSGVLTNEVVPKPVILPSLCPSHHEWSPEEQQDPGCLQKRLCTLRG